MAAADLRRGDVVVVEAGEVVPGDGDVVEGIASVDESAITGESAPVIRESGGDRSAVTGGTRVLSYRIVVRITQEPGASFLDRMIALVEGASRAEDAERDRAEHPARRADHRLPARGRHAAAARDLLHAVQADREATPVLDADGVTGIVLVSLLVCLIPTTIGALLSAIGIAGMDRLVQRNVLAMSGRAVEAAGDVSTLLLDKTGTITLGNRQAGRPRHRRGGRATRLAEAAQLSSLADETPEGRSVVVLAKNGYGLRARATGELTGPPGCRSPPRPGCPASTCPAAPTTVAEPWRSARARPRPCWPGSRQHGGAPRPRVGEAVDGISAAGGTPLVVAERRGDAPAGPSA